MPTARLPASARPSTHRTAACTIRYAELYCDLLRPISLKIRNPDLDTDRKLNTGNNTFALPIIDQAASPTTFVKSGVGTWVLSGASTYSGVTNVNRGELVVTGSLSEHNVGACGGWRNPGRHWRHNYPGIDHRLAARSRPALQDVGEDARRSSVGGQLAFLAPAQR